MSTAMLDEEEVTTTDAAEMQVKVKIAGSTRSEKAKAKADSARDYNLKGYSDIQHVGYIREQYAGQTRWRQVYSRKMFEGRALSDIVESSDIEELYARIRYQHPLPDELHPYAEHFVNLVPAGSLSLKFLNWDQLPEVLYDTSGSKRKREDVFNYDRGKVCTYTISDFPRLLSPEDLSDEFVEFLQTVAQRLTLLVTRAPRETERILKEYVGGWVCTYYDSGRETKDGDPIDWTKLRFDMAKHIRWTVAQARREASGGYKVYDPPFKANDVTALYGSLRSYADTMLNNGGKQWRRGSTHGFEDQTTSKMKVDDVFDRIKDLVEKLEARFGPGAHWGCDYYKRFMEKVRPNVPEALRKAGNMSGALADWIASEVELWNGITRLDAAIGVGDEVSHYKDKEVYSFKEPSNYFWSL